MRPGVCLLIGVVATLLGLASARASAAGATTTTDSTTTTTAATTTTSTATTPTVSYAPLGVSSLPAGCVGAGVAAVVPPSHPVVALGTPASDLGPSGYPASATTVAFSSSTTSGSTCKSATITLASVSLFEGAVTASSIEATDGTGTVTGLEIDGSAVPVGTGQTVAVESWGQLTLGAKVGRLLSPLVVRLLQAHDGLGAGTRIAVAFSAAPGPLAKASKRHASTSHRGPKATAGSHRHARQASKKKQRPAKAPPDYPATPYPFLISGALPDAAQDNPVVSIALRYLNVPYQWGGASPKTGFDCSGLVTYVFAQLGVSLPHYAASQWHSPDTVWVPPNRLKPGDLVFFTGSDGTRKAPGHVGIYVGDGYLIDAPHTGAFVQIDSLDDRWFANQYVGARKIVSPLRKPRHLLSAAAPGVSAGVSFLGLPSPLAIEPLGQPLAAAVVPARTPPREYWILACIGIGALLVLLATGGVLVRRHRSTDPTSSAETLN